MAMCLTLLTGILLQPVESTPGSKLQFVTFLVYLVLGLILGFLLRHLLSLLNFSRKRREKKLRTDLETQEKKIAQLTEENENLKAALIGRDK